MSNGVQKNKSFKECYEDNERIIQLCTSTTDENVEVIENFDAVLENRRIFIMEIVEEVVVVVPNTDAISIKYFVQETIVIQFFSERSEELGYILLELVGNKQYLIDVQLTISYNEEKFRLLSDQATNGCDLFNGMLF